MDCKVETEKKITLLFYMHVTKLGQHIKVGKLRVRPVPKKLCPFPRMIVLLYLRSVMEAATLVIQGLKERIELEEGPPLPAA